MSFDNLLEDDKRCPECDKVGEETERLEYRCTNDNCDVMSWFA